MGFCFVIYMLVGVIGIYSYGEDLAGNIFDNIGAHQNWISYSLRIFFLVVISTHTPFIIFVGKEAMLTLIASVTVLKAQENEIRKSTLRKSYVSKKASDRQSEAESAFAGESEDSHLTE